MALPTVSESDFRVIASFLNRLGLFHLNEHRNYLESARVYFHLQYLSNLFPHGAKDQTIAHVCCLFAGLMRALNRFLLNHKKRQGTTQAEQASETSNLRSQVIQFAELCMQTSDRLDGFLTDNPELGFPTNGQVWQLEAALAKSYAAKAADPTLAIDTLLLQLTKDKTGCPDPDKLEIVKRSSRPWSLAFHLLGSSQLDAASLRELDEAASLRLLKDAETNMKSALKLRWTQDTSEVARSYARLALIQQHKAKKAPTASLQVSSLREARDACAQALRIQIPLLGPQHIATQNSDELLRQIDCELQQLGSWR